VSRSWFLYLDDLIEGAVKKLMECLTKLGRDIEIVVRAAPRSRRERKLTVAEG
jgi:hypothetical protein